MRKVIYLMLFAIFMLATTVSAHEGEMIREYRFTTTNSNFNVDAPYISEFVYDGNNKYALVNVTHKGLHERSQSVIEREFQGLLRQEVPKTIEENGVVYELQDVEFVAVDGGHSIIAFTDFLEMTKRPDNVPRTKEVDGVTAFLVNVVMLDSETWTYGFTVPARFIGGPGIRYYILPDGTRIPVNPDTPEFYGYENAILTFLGRDPDTHRITSGRWTSNYTYNANGNMVRHAEFSGYRKTATFRANYGVSNLTYDAVATFVSHPDLEEGITLYEVLAIATYERVHASDNGGLTMIQIIIRVATAIVVLAVLIAGILYLLGRRKKQQSSQN